MARAHVNKTLRDSDGTIITGASVRVLNDLATTPVAGTLYAADTGNETYTNPFVATSGVISFFLDAPQRVRLGVTPPGGSEIFFESVDVIVTRDSLVIEDDGTPLPTRSALNLYGPGVLLDDDPSNDATRLRLGGIGGGTAAVGTAEFVDQANSFYQRGDGYFLVQTAATEGELYVVTGQPGGGGGDGLRFARVVDAAIAAHLADTADAHDASAISYVPGGSVAATDVQTAIGELATEKYGPDNLPPTTEVVNAANSGTAVTLPDVTTATLHRITLTGNATITLPTPAAGKSITVVVVQDGTGSRTLTFSTPSGTIKTAGGTAASTWAPTVTATAGKEDIYTFVCTSTNWLGLIAGQNF